MELAVKALNGFADVELSSNEMLFGFEADIVLRVYDEADVAQGGPRGTPKYIINVEIDGPSHSYATKHRFTQLRDEHLRLMHGVRVVRWDVMSPEHQRKGKKEIMRDFLVLIKRP